MKRLIITENAGVAILPNNNINMEVLDPSGKPVRGIEVKVEDKDLKNIDKIKADAIKKLKKTKG